MMHTKINTIYTSGEYKLELEVNKSFCHLHGLQRTRDLIVAAALVIYRPADVYKAPKDKRRFKQDQQELYKSLWLRCLTGVWVNYEAETDKLNIAVPAGTPAQNEFSERTIQKAISGVVTDAAGAFAEGRSLGLPSNRSRGFVAITIKKASYYFDIPADTMESLTSHIKQIDGTK